MGNIDERIFTEDSWLILNYYNFHPVRHSEKCNGITSIQGAILSSVLTSLWAVSPVGFILTTSLMIPSLWNSVQAICCCNLCVLLVMATTGLPLKAFWDSNGGVVRKWAITALLWRSRPRADSGLDVDCLALVVIAVPGVEMSGRFCVRRGAAGAAEDAGQRCAQCTVRVKLIRETTHNLSVLLVSLLCSTCFVKFCMHRLTFQMLEQM